MFVTPVIHVGPPKTGTTSLQSSVIPHLGRPFQIKPDWARSVAREAVVRDPGDLPQDLIVSHESLGDFSVFPPRVIAERLHALLPGARLIFVSRDPVESFYSLYRQRLLNHVQLLNDEHLEAKVVTGTGLKPLSPDQFFERELAIHREDGRGFFAMIQTETVQRTFAALFEVHTIPFRLLQDNARHFVEAFSDICGAAPKPDISHENPTDTAVWSEALAQIAPRVMPALIERLDDHFRHPRLRATREQFIRRWPDSTNLAAFIDALRFDLF